MLWERTAKLEEGGSGICRVSQSGSSDPYPDCHSEPNSSHINAVERWQGEHAPSRCLTTSKVLPLGCFSLVDPVYHGSSSFHQGHLPAQFHECWGLVAGPSVNILQSDSGAGVFSGQIVLTLYV